MYDPLFGGFGACVGQVIAGGAPAGARLETPRDPPGRSVRDLVAAPVCGAPRPVSRCCPQRSGASESGAAGSGSTVGAVSRCRGRSTVRRGAPSLSLRGAAGAVSRGRCRCPLSGRCQSVGPSLSGGPAVDPSPLSLSAGADGRGFGSVGAPSPRSGAQTAPWTVSLRGRCRPFSRSGSGAVPAAGAAVRSCCWRVGWRPVARSPSQRPSTRCRTA